MSFETSFKDVILDEGGYKLHRNAGEGADTYAGIYRKAHPNWPGWGYIDRQETPPTDLVRGLYFDVYWVPVRGDDLADKVAHVLFSFAVNAGLTTAVKLAQLVAGSQPDGVLGPKTLAAIQAIDPDLFVARYTLAKIARYVELARKEPARYRKFLEGWLIRALGDAA